MTSRMSKIGAVFYVIWGLLHLKAARDVYVLATTVQPGLAQGRLLQSAWNLLAFSVAAIILAAWLNWKNDKVGYWANLAARLSA